VKQSLLFTRTHYGSNLRIISGQAQGTAMPKNEQAQLGKLPSQYRFFLNPYVDEQFTRCPSCRDTTKSRKRPFLVHVNPRNLLGLNMTGRYCPACELMILHQDKLEDLLVRACERHDSSIIGNDYLVIGTVERRAWRDAQKHPSDYETIFANLHDFQEYVFFEPLRGWVLSEAKEGTE
jgi:hypothetical protein